MIELFVRMSDEMYSVHCVFSYWMENITCQVFNYLLVCACLLADLSSKYSRLVTGLSVTSFSLTDLKISEKVMGHKILSFPLWLNGKNISEEKKRGSVSMTFDDRLKFIRLVLPIHSMISSSTATNVACLHNGAFDLNIGNNINSTEVSYELNVSIKSKCIFNYIYLFLSSKNNFARILC